MTATAEVRFGDGGPATVRSYVRLTASTHIQCCTYPDAAPILSIGDGPVGITITNPGRGEATADDVTFARQLAKAVAEYAAELERIVAAAQKTGPGPDDASVRAA